MAPAYVHGHHRRERQRLQDQAGALVDLLHGDTTYPKGSRVLEAGCGVGAQTVALARRSPGAAFVSIDVAGPSLAVARRAVDRARLDNVELQRADILDLPFANASFDHVFVCFVLEHLSEPSRALARLRRVLKPSGTLTIIEGDHGSTYFHPDSATAHAAIRCQVALQAKAGGNALLGRQVYPLMVGAGLHHVHVSPRTVYVDASRPDLVENFTEKTFITMIEGVRQPAIAAGLTTARRFNAGIRDLRRTTRADGVFCYTFFKGVGMRAETAVVRPGPPFSSPHPHRSGRRTTESATYRQPSPPSTRSRTR
jgi:SAM-dependent methyltransferase